MRKVVITGMGAITPIGNDVPTFWEGLVSGRCGVSPIEAFDTSPFKVKLAATVKDFDPTLYMDRNEIRKSDLFVQYAMAAACQAVYDSGIEGKIDPERFGVYFGSGIGGFSTFASEMKKMLEKGPKRVSPFFIPMLIANMASGNIAIRFNAQGECLPVTTACATGSNAIGEAFRAIRHGYADAIITGGSEAPIIPVALAGFGNMMALSTSEDPMCASIPFDKRRDGFVMGEGSGALVLEEYEHAKKRNAKVYAQIVGYGSTCDAYHITAPQPDAIGSSRAIVEALKEAGDYKKVYINAHGTSTPLNDATETLAIKKAFGERCKEDVLVSSTKSMTGHMLGAAGAVEAIAAVLSLKNGIIPPTIGLNQPDPECDLDYVPNAARKAEVDLALSTSFGFGGHNACLAFAKTEGFDD